MDGLEIGFDQVVTNINKERIVNMSVFVLVSFMCNLRVEEILKLVLGETRDFIDESKNHRKHKHIMLPLRGRFNGEVKKTFILLLPC